MASYLIFSVSCVGMEDVIQLFSWGMLDISGFWSFCDLCFGVFFGVWYWKIQVTYLSRWVGAFNSLAIYLCLQCKKSRSCFFKFTLCLCLISLPLYQDIRIFDAWALSEYTRGNKDSRYQKVLWIVVVILLMVAAWVLWGNSRAFSDHYVLAANVGAGSYNFFWRS